MIYGRPNHGMKLIWVTKSFPIYITNGSRILLTTRNIDVASHPNFKRLVHNTKFLDDEKSLKLLKNKAFPPYLVVSNPLRIELENQCPKLIRKCKGLPLALVVLGGYLSKHLDSHTWSRMAENVDWNEAGNKIDITKILALSYHDLPTYLKTTFLYITTFPEDHIIECSELINLWIAEGFVPPSQKYNLETTAQTYVDQLYQRGLVQVEERGRVYGRISRIRIHDVMHDWGIERAREEDFFHVIKKINHVTPCDPYAYCVALHGYWYQNIAASMPYLRTILGFELLANWLELCGLRSVRVIHLTNKTYTNTSLKGIKHMIFLRHIFLRYCRDIFFHSSIGELCNLQTLKCHDTAIWCLPNSFWEITSLRHVHLESNYCTWNGPKKGTGKNIQTLVILDRSSQLRVGKLQKLMTRACRGIDAVALAIEEMEQIVQLHLDRWPDPLPRNLLSKISSLSHLEVLELENPIKGLTTLRAANLLPRNILKLTLHCEELVEDPMPVLQELSRLVELKLLCGWELKRMHCSASGFSCLKYLTLDSFSSLEDWKVPVGAMPSLCHLKLEFCPSLKEFPEGLMEHAQLQLVELVRSYSLSKVDYSRLEEKDCKIIRKP